MGENMIREPAVAGAFYESNVKYLRESIEDCFKHMQVMSILALLQLMLILN